MAFSRTTISIPASLKVEMKEYKSVNWSSVAAEAFRAEVDRQSRLKPGKANNMTDRLRASKEAFEAECKANGSAGGQTWARDSAQYPEMRNVLQLEDEQDFWSHFGDGEDPSLSYARDYASRVAPKEDWEEFWEAAVGDDWKQKVDSRSFVQGFHEGAFEQFAAVESEI